MTRIARLRFGISTTAGSQQAEEAQHNERFEDFGSHLQLFQLRSKSRGEQQVRPGGITSSRSGSRQSCSA
ncbi:hypothetical protein, partial [Pseudomonas sp. NBRC 111142]|uniref:hypothetical protein n=1 Tax=Pseudomonas sp. NBRC 111142 TaxID=1661057 RepID=UPI001C47D142